MTAPDDLARTLAEHRYTPHYPGSEYGYCACSPYQKGWFVWEKHLAEVLASVVSRRDTDLRTRIENLREELSTDQSMTLAPGWMVRDACVAKLARGLVGVTREDAP